MCKELKKEIEENQNLGRRLRRKKERELQKKYHKNNIKKRRVIQKRTKRIAKRQKFLKRIKKNNSKIFT